MLDTCIMYSYLDLKYFGQWEIHIIRTCTCTCIALCTCIIHTCIIHICMHLLHLAYIWHKCTCMYMYVHIHMYMYMYTLFNVVGVILRMYYKNVVLWNCCSYTMTATDKIVATDVVASTSHTSLTSFVTFRLLLSCLHREDFNINSRQNLDTTTRWMTGHSANWPVMTGHWGASLC